jgi:hypothetical protein
VTLQGHRRPHHQIALCSGCGRKHLILPASPWLAHASAKAARGSTSHLHPGRLLLVIVAGGVAAMGLIFFAVKPYLRRGDSALIEAPAANIRGRIEAGQRELREGNVHLAAEVMRSALRERERNPDALGREELQRLQQLYRQCDLLARLLDRSLEEILQQALHHRDDNEWSAKFADYRGRTVVFDDVLRRDADGRPVLAAYVAQVGEVKARIAFEDLSLFRPMSLDPPQRALFGAALASCRREEGGVWVVRFEPDSAVLLTDDDAAAACCPPPLDVDLRAVLRRQAEWLKR